ncbi:ATP synthase F1 subunit gamma [Candidatus Gottesmanbacteria bacterium]|nr:ATP synthase F1 subunit gamma [Candidatus Gottesmanbacteria bacterium]
MANIRLIKRRIRSVKNIAQITKAMQLVAASKMRKAQEAANSGRRYAEKIAEMVTRLAWAVDISQHPLLVTPPPTGKKLVIVISTNKGLCGGLNTNLFRFFFKEYAKPSAHEYLTIGQKGTLLLERMRLPVVADFSTTIPFLNNVPALTELVVQKYIAGGFEGVDIVYSDFVSALRQNPKKRVLLPLSIAGSAGTQQSLGQYLIEPTPEEVLNFLIPHYIENQIRDALLQAEASEHSARMIAMKNATDNALSLRDELTLVYNRARQEKITYEILDIVTARLAVEV